MRVSVIICAAGSGTRAGFEKNKLLVPVLCGGSALWHTVKGVYTFGEKLKNSGGIDNLEEIIIACSPIDMAEITAICAPYNCKIVEGGNTRTESVYNALKAVTGDSVLIQDGARPFTTVEQYTQCLEYVKQFGSAVVAMPAVDTIAIEINGCIGNIPARNSVFNIQTPQGFFTQVIRTAYESAVKSGLEFTDDSSVYSRYVAPARICMCGTAENKKLTFKGDFDGLDRACVEKLSLNGERVGFGVDVHSFGKKCKHVTLCGVEVPCDEGLVAHSDGDVALHAVMDAILSAAGLNDIGHYFPDSDPQYKDADSGELLKSVISLIKERGFCVDGLSIAIQAEKPRLSPYIEQMKERLSSLTGVGKERIGIAAGTCEGLGFVGEKRGICAYCAATLKEI
ncbi:MAG: 2-C-methyl-D-erythritol 2,4-cyclodiphosphate synthase [Clostridia bacterium]|nr:2-C-methyl-D-erythritol 2,4-cyclodiphosphate synthase [Clostridia bacterium]